MRVMVTGANGFLGGVLTRNLTNLKYTVLPIVRVKENEHDIQCDMKNLDTLLYTLDKYKPKVIVNCAAKVDFSENSKQAQYKVNVLAPVALSSWCLDNNAHLIQTSGSIVNGSVSTRFNNHTEEMPYNYYGKTKLLADQAIRLSQCYHTIVRFGGIFGDDGPGHLGINNAISNAKRGIVPTIFGTGAALRNYLHVEDAANLLIHCMENQITGTHYAGNHKNISVKQMLVDICDVYLNGVMPLNKEGEDSVDQITEVSASLPRTMPFKEALIKYQ